MKKTDTINYGVGIVALIETDPAATFFQITAIGTAGNIRVEARTSDIGPYEPVLAGAGETAVIFLSLVTPSTCLVGPYNIREFRLTPDAGAAAYTIIFSQWGE